MTGQRERGLLDTSVVVDLKNLSADALPRTSAISAITLAELAAGPLATDDPDERARRQARLQQTEAQIAPLAFDAEAARAFGQVYARVRAAGRSARGRRAVDLLIAAAAVAHGLPLYTRNPDDFAHLDGLVEVIGV